MLKRLQIQNYAIIEALGIDFSGRMNAITGETGAGKSILMGALSLLLGDRADSTVLLNREKKCIVEGAFTPEGKKDVLDFFRANDLDPEEEIVIRREIAPNGKSRAFINDSPVLLEQLRKLSSLLVDLHRQFDTLELGESDFQRDVLDALAGQTLLVEEYRSAYRAWITAGKELAALQEEKARFNKELDYNKFLFDELDEIGLHENELEELDQELKLLNHAEEIKTTLTKISYDLNEGEQPIVQRLRSYVQQLNHFGAYHPDLESLLRRMQSTQIELQDMAGELERINDHIGYDARRIGEINERLSSGYKLLKKHGVNATSDLLHIKAGLEKKLQAVLNLDDLIAACEGQAGNLLREARKIALVLSKNRQAQRAPLEEQVNRLLRQVGMPNARLKVQVQSGEGEDVRLGPAGMDEIEFLFDANKSQRFEPIRKVASGGELSRLMLCISSLVAQSIDLPTLIFDEIDSGISGEAARQVGIILKELSGRRQVICITHQPQIAGKADAHYFVYKEVSGDGIKTGIRLLTREERITAIAQMLGGEKPTAAAIQNAREMVMN
ncbi:MAG: DNA repair protein RecN [Bacteroidota bacterium]|nr:DNA repair protein RecN [Bacteroidota bacterium]